MLRIDNVVFSDNGYLITQSALHPQAVDLHVLDPCLTAAVTSAKDLSHKAYPIPLIE